MKKELKDEIAYLALEKIADPNYTMRMVEAQRALEKIEKLATKKSRTKGLNDER